MRALILVLLALTAAAVFASAAPSQLTYQVGQEFVFSLHSVVDGKGREVSTGSRTSGSFATLDSTVAVKCTDTDATSYLFVMNMFGTTVNVGQGAQNPATVTEVPPQPSTQSLLSAFSLTKRSLADNSALGYDMYFQQNKSGEIVQIWYQSDDSMFFVNVKLGAINAFQTKVIQPGKTEKVMESDPVGHHYSVVTGLSQASVVGGPVALVVNKTFNQADFVAFPDPSLKPGNIMMSAMTSTGIHSEGYIYSSSVAQAVDLVNARTNPGTSVFNKRQAADKKVAAPQNTLGFDMRLSSQGTLSIALTGISRGGLGSDSFFSPTAAVKRFASLALPSSDYVKTTLFEASYKASQFVLLQPPTDAEVEKAMVALFSRETYAALPKTQEVRMMDVLARFVRASSTETPQLRRMQDMLAGGADVFDRHTAPFAAARERILYVLVKAEDDASLIRLGLKSTDRETRFRALLAVGAGLRNPSRQVVSVLRDMASMELNKDAELRRASLLAYGAVASRLSCPAMRAEAAEALEQRLVGLMRASSSEESAAGGVDMMLWEEITAVVDAMGNAGPRVVPVDALAELLAHERPSVRLSAARAFRKFLDAQAAQEAALDHHDHDDEADDLMRMHAAILLHSRLASPFAAEADSRIRRVIAGLLEKRFPMAALFGTHDASLHLDDAQASSDFPFNKSYTATYTVGGSVANATFNGQLFAGTNFDCHQHYFNYEGLAQATVDAALFDWSKEAVDAEAVYGRQNGAPLADRIYLRVWDDVLYDKPIPSIDCSEHTYPIAHASPGFSVSYTVWVSTIPIVFTASATLNLDLSWGWDICDSTLSAMVELIPAATLTIAGDVEVNVLILRAGLELEGSFNTELRPQASIQGSLCELEFDIRQTSQAMSADFNAYYVWNQCKYWIFDCHWGKHNEKVLWSWSLPSQDKVVYDVTWPIKP